jgi:uncharacterized protein with PQ loop repeat
MGVFSYMIDISYNEKIKNKDNFNLNLVLLLHHFLSMYILFGVLSNNIKFLKIYTFILMVIFVSWIIFDDVCLITELTDNLDNNKLGFDNGFLMIYKKMFKEKSESDYKNEKSMANYILLPLLIMISFYKIHKLTSK